MLILPLRRLSFQIAACAAAAAAMLAGCGFRLAGSQPLAPALTRPYVSLKDPYTDFSREFERQLRASGAAIQADSTTASAEIDISKDAIEQRILSV
jgi:LPS-assembly lipoprotein